MCLCNSSVGRGAAAVQQCCCICVWPLCLCLCRGLSSGPEWHRCRTQCRIQCRIRSLDSHYLSSALQNTTVQHANQCALEWPPEMRYRCASAVAQASKQTSQLAASRCTTVPAHRCHKQTFVTDHVQQMSLPVGLQWRPSTALPDRLQLVPVCR